MNDILLATIPAALVLTATLGARFVEHYLQSKRETGRQQLERERETRDAKRRYRESIATPIKEALTELHGHLGKRWMLDTINKVTGQSVTADSKLKNLISKCEKDVISMEKADLVKLNLELVPLALSITNDSVREAVKEAFLHGSFGRDGREQLGITEEDMKKSFDLAFQKLEYYVALAD